MKFKVGDKVKISKDSEFYVDSDESNPKDIEGEIYELNNSSYSEFKYRVRWPKGRNSYKEEDLELVEDMNQEIEVGDIVNGLSFKNFKIASIHGSQYFDASGRSMSIINAVLVSKADKQEIVAYELLKDLPGIPAGTIGKKTTETRAGNYEFKGPNTFNDMDPGQLSDTTWFKPIYKAKEVVVKISKGREVKLEGNKVTLPDGSVTFEEVKELHKFVNSNYSKRVSGFNVKFGSFNIQVGCQEFTKEDIQLVYQAIQNLK